MYRDRDLNFLKLNLWEWVKGTIDKICLEEPITVKEWNSAWERTYFELGGKKGSAEQRDAQKRRLTHFITLGE